MQEERTDPERRPSAYVAGAIVNIVMLWLVNAIPGWDWRFITGDFPAVLWALNLSIGMQIAGNALLLFLHPRLLHHLVQAVMQVASLLAVVVMVTVYPFAFDEVLFNGADVVVRVLLYVGIGGTVIGIIVHGIKAVGSLFARASG
jgi:hypothetical protein